MVFVYLPESKFQWLFFLLKIVPLSSQVSEAESDVLPRGGRLSLSILQGSLYSVMLYPIGSAPIGTLCWSETRSTPVLSLNVHSVAIVTWQSVSTLKPLEAWG